MSTGQGSTVDVDIEMVGYAPVGSRSHSSIRRDAQIEQGSSIPQSFEGYIEEIAIKSDIIDVKHGDFTNQSTVGNHLSTLLNSSNSQSFQNETIALAVRLNGKMNGTAKDGTMFVAKAELDGPNSPHGPVDVISLIKMDDEGDYRIVQRSNGLDEVVEDDAFPPRERLQKGAIYPGNRAPPSSRQGDVKVYQRSFASYFENFFGFDTILPSSLKQSQEALDACDDIMRNTVGRSLEGDDVSEIINQANSQSGTVDQGIIESALNTVTNGSVSSSDVNAEFSSRNLSNLQINADQFPKYGKATVNTPNGEVTVKYPFSADRNIDIDMSSNEIEIQGNHIDSDYVAK